MDGEITWASFSENSQMNSPQTSIPIVYGQSNMGDRLAHSVLDCLTIALFNNSRVFFSCFRQFSSQPASHDNYDLLARVGLADSKPTSCIIHLYLFNKNILISCTATTIWNTFSTKGCKYV